MITAKIGEKIVNCFDGEHSRETLKTWADKGILKCPACGKEYEYCHGRVVRPYFRHKEKTDCVDKYSEPETNEHIQGKIALYNWIKDQEGVTDVVLEAWISETRQRPDIAFKYNGEQYVFEFQCSPISTVYLERHELYQTAGIKDIWILGTEKYSNKYSRGKYIEQFAVGNYDVKHNAFVYVKDSISINDLPYKMYRPTFPWYENINNFIFCGKIKVGQNILEKYIKKDRKLWVDERSKIIIERHTDYLYSKCEKLFEQYSHLRHNYSLDISYKNKHSRGKYCRIVVWFSCKYTNTLAFYVYDKRVDVHKISSYDNEIIDTFEYKSLNEMYSKITTYIGDRIREKMYGLNWRNDING